MHMHMSLLNSVSIRFILDEPPLKPEPAVAQSPGKPQSYHRQLAWVLLLAHKRDYGKMCHKWITKPH